VTFGSLFSGIGGFDLGLERAGMKCVWQVEIDPFCRQVLAKHWPHVRRWDDVRTFPPEGDNDNALRRQYVDLICGGFPCQPLSLAGRLKGENDERFLWPDFARIIRILGPRYVLVENVPGVLSHGLGRLLRDLAKIGYDAVWAVLSACSMGAPHTRERVFVLGNSQSVKAWSDGRPESAQTEKRWVPEPGKRPRAAGTPWADEPRISRTLDGVSNRMDRNKSLGNAVIPQVAEWLGKMILSIEQNSSEQA
jgi:DNA (cytosine-5)-methyltransferase 1